MKNTWERGLSGVVKETDDGTGNSEASRIMTMSLLNASTSSLLNNSGLLDTSEAYGDDDDMLLGLSESVEFFHRQPAYKDNQKTQSKRDVLLYGDNVGSPGRNKKKNKQKKRTETSRKIDTNNLELSIRQKKARSKKKKSPNEDKHKRRSNLRRAQSADNVFGGSVLEEFKDKSSRSLANAIDITESSLSSDEGALAYINQNVLATRVADDNQSDAVSISSVSLNGCIRRISSNISVASDESSIHSSTSFGRITEKINKKADRAGGINLLSSKDHGDSESSLVDTILGMTFNTFIPPPVHGIDEKVSQEIVVIGSKEITSEDSSVASWTKKASALENMERSWSIGDLPGAVSLGRTRSHAHNDNAGVIDNSNFFDKKSDNKHQSSGAHTCTANVLDGDGVCFSTRFEKKERTTLHHRKENGVAALARNSRSSLCHSENVNKAIKNNDSMLEKQISKESVTLHKSRKLNAYEGEEQMPARLGKNPIEEKVQENKDCFETKCLRHCSTSSQHHLEPKLQGGDNCRTGGTNNSSIPCQSSDSLREREIHSSESSRHPRSRRHDHEQNRLMKQQEGKDLGEDFKNSSVHYASTRSKSSRDLFIDRTQTNSTRGKGRRVGEQHLSSTLHSSMPNLDFSESNHEQKHGSVSSKKVKRRPTVFLNESSSVELVSRDKIQAMRDKLKKSKSAFSITEGITCRRSSRPSERNLMLDDRHSQHGVYPPSRKAFGEERRSNVERNRNRHGMGDRDDRHSKSRRSQLRRTHSVDSVINQNELQPFTKCISHKQNIPPLARLGSEKYFHPPETELSKHSKNHNVSGRLEPEKQLRKQYLASENTNDDSNSKTMSGEQKSICLPSKSSVATRVDAFYKSQSLRDLCPENIKYDSVKTNQNEENSTDRRNQLQHKRGSSVRELSAKLEGQPRPAVHRHNNARGLSRCLSLSRTWKSERHLRNTKPEHERRMQCHSDELSRKLAQRRAIMKQQGSTLERNGSLCKMIELNKEKSRRGSTLRSLPVQQIKSMDASRSEVECATNQADASDGSPHRTEQSKKRNPTITSRRNSRDEKYSVVARNRTLKREFSALLCTEPARIALEEACARIKDNDEALVSLDLSDILLGDAGIGLLGLSLRKNEHLRSLNLANTGITAGSAINLAGALLRNTSLEKLYLQKNKLGDSGVEVLAAAFQQNNTLKLLNLSQNEIGDIGAAALDESLQQNTSLEQLYLYSNQIGNIGASALSELLLNNRTLKEMYVWDNKFAATGIAILQSAQALRKTKHPESHMHLRLK